MAPRRVLVIFIVLLLTATFFVARNHRYVHAQTQPQTPSIYTSTNLKGAELKKVVTEHPEILTQLNPEGRNLLSLIFSYQHPSAEDVQMLLEKGSDARNSDYHGNGVLHFAVGAGTPEIIRLLVNAGADVNQRDQWGLTPLREAVRYPGEINKDNAELLISLGAYLDTYTAAALGKTSELQKFLAADPNSLNPNDSIYDLSAIYVAVTRHQRASLKVIADSHAKVDLFGAAAIGDQSAVADAINKAPGTINTKDRHGLTPLDWAVMAEDASMTKFLLDKYGADPDRSRALSIAAQSGNINIAKLLLDHGADPSDPKKINPDGSESVNPYRVDPYEIAINFHHPEIAELIMQARKKN